MLSSRPPIFLISSHSNFSQLRSQDPYLCTQTLRHRIRSSRTQITDAGSPFPSPPPHRSFVLSPCELDSRSWSPPCSDRPSERARRRSSVRRRRRPTPRVDRLLLTRSSPSPADASAVTYCSAARAIVVDKFLLEYNADTNAISFDIRCARARSRRGITRVAHPDATSLSFLSAARPRSSRISMPTYSSRFRSMGLVFRAMLMQRAPPFSSFPSADQCVCQHRSTPSIR